MCARWILILATAAVWMLPAAEMAAQPAPPLATQQQTRYFTTSFSFEDVNLARVQGWLARVGIEIPVALDGEVSIDVEVGVPLTALTNGRLYRVNGTVTAGRLEIERVALHNVAATIRYADGVATLQQLRFRVPAGDEPEDAAGAVAGQATLQVAPRGDMTAQARLDGVPLEPVLEIFPELAGLARGRVSGDAQARVALEQFTEIAAWVASGRMTGTALQGYGVTIEQAIAEARLQDGRLTLDAVRAEVLGGVADGNGALGLTGEQPFSTQLQWTGGDVAELLEILPEGTIPYPVRGDVAVAVAAEGTLEPLQYVATGNVHAVQLVVNEYPIPSLAFAFRADAAELQVRELVLQTPNGRITGPADLPFEPAQSAAFNMELAGIRIVPFVEQVLMQPVPPEWGVAGVLSGRVAAEVPMNAWEDLAQWQAQGQLFVSDFRALARAGQIATDFRLNNGVVQLANGRAQLGTATLTGSGQLALSAPFAFSLAAELAGGDLNMLADLPPPWRPPVAVGGLVSAVADVSGSLNPLQLNGEARVAARDVSVSTLQIPQAEARLQFAGRQMEVADLVAQIGAGQVRGSASIPFDLAGGLEASLQWQSLELRPWAAALARAYEDLPPGLFAGTADGHVELTIPAGTLQQPARWSGQGELAVRDFAVLLWDFNRVEAAFRVADGTAEVRRFVAVEDRESLTGSFTAGLAAPYPFSAEVSWEQGDFRSLSQTALGETLSALQLAGRFDLSTRVTGAFQPWELTGQGSLAAQNVHANGLQIDEASLDYMLDRDQLDIRNVRSRLYGGTAEGAIVIPLDGSDEEGNGRTKGSVTWQDLHLGPLTEALGQTALSLRGLFSGRLVAAVPLSRWSELAAWQAELTFQLAELQTEAGQPLGSLAGAAALAESVFRYEAEGGVLGGQVSLAGQWWGIATQLAPRVPTADQPPAAPLPAEANAGRLQFQGVRLEQLRAVLPELELPEGAEASIDLALRYGHGPELGIAAGRGEVAIANLRSDGRLLIERLQGALFLSEEAVEFRGLVGRYAQGRLQLNVVAPRTGRGPTSFGVALTGASTSQVLGFWPDWAEALDGQTDLRLRAMYDDRWRISGSATWLGAEVAGTDIGRWRFMLMVDYDPESERAYLRFRDVNGHWARGRISGRAEMTVRRGIQLSGDARFTGLDLQPLLRSLDVSDRVGTGRITGTLAFGGRNVQGLGDLTADLDAVLSNTAATAVPLMRQLQTYLAPVILASTNFDEGQLRGRLSRGVFYVQRFSLASQAAQLYGTGTVTIAGRLNLEVTANTGGLEQNQVLARTLLERLIVLSQPPVALLLRVNEFLSDRVIYLHITGTWTAPVIRIRPARALAEEAARFFLQQAVQ